MAILVIGKNRALSLIIKSYLEQGGLQNSVLTHHFYDSLERVQDLTKGGHEIELVLLDTDDQPDTLNPHEYRDFIKVIQDITHAPILILVDQYDHTLTLKFLSYGVSDFIAKPVKRDYLMLRIAVWLNLTSLEEKPHTITSFNNNFDTLFKPYDNVKKELTELKESIQKHRQYINTNMDVLKKFTRPFDKAKPEEPFQKMDIKDTKM